MWVAFVCVGLGISGFAPVGQTAMIRKPPAAPHSVLEILSPVPGDFALKLDYPWGGIAASRVYFDNHDGPFEAVVEPSGPGVRVTFKGWEEKPFVATAEKVRIIYHRPGAGRVDVLAEAMPGGEVRIQPVGRPPIRGRNISVHLGGNNARYVNHQRK
jgi:hypothetical protein